SQKKGSVAVGKVKYISESQLGDGFSKYEQWLNLLTQNANNFTEIYKECVIPSPNFLIHREDLDLIDAFNPNIYPEDYDLTFRMYAAKMQVAGVNEITHFWRDYPTRSSRTQTHYQHQYFVHLKVD